MPADWNQIIPTRRSLLSRLKHWDDQKSWQDFYGIYRQLVFSSAVKRGLTEAEAEDVVQETFIAVADKIQGFKYEPEKCSFKTWLHAITKRKVADQFRKRQGKGRLLEPLSTGLGEETEALDIPDPASLALDEVWEQDWKEHRRKAAVERVKQQTSPAQFQIFDYHVLQEHSVGETARALKISPARVYLATHRMKAKVRQEIARLKAVYEYY